MRFEAYNTIIVKGHILGWRETVWEADNLSVYILMPNHSTSQKPCFAHEEEKRINNYLTTSRSRFFI